MKKWALQPGESKSMNYTDFASGEDITLDDFQELIESYIDDNDYHKTAVMSDRHELVFFLGLNEEWERQSLDVAAYKDHGYVFLSEEMGEKLFAAFVDYSSLVAEVDQYLEGKQEGE